MGCIGLSYSDFCRLSPDEFGAVCRSYAEEREADLRERWERTRLLAAVSVQPHVRKKLTPQQLIPLPWDKAPRKWEKEIVSAKEDKRRLSDLVKRRYQRKEE